MASHSWDYYGCFIVRVHRRLARRFTSAATPASLHTNVMDLDNIAAALGRWASRHPQIKRVYLFGSRVRGDHHRDSDLDIAVELDENLDESGGLATWMIELKPAWI